MREILDVLEKINKDTIYHVTHTDRIPKIRKSGLLPMQTSNWVKAANKERYGSGEVFAFTDKRDAIRWGARMDWEFNKSMGTGKISILTMRQEGDWDIDDADPLSQAGNAGKWIKTMGSIRPENILETEPLTIEMIRGIN
jgi:hypothetical protein